MIGIHSDNAGELLYEPKCFKLAIQIPDIPNCTEELPYIMDKSSVIMNNTPRVVYPNLN